MQRVLIVSCLVLVATACGPRPRPPIFTEEDAGLTETPDAGRQRGMEPPTGFSTAVELPADGGARFGVSVSAAADQFNQPLIAAVWDDPNGDGSRLDTRVIFTRWNGEQAAFDPVKTIEVVGEIDLTPPLRQVSVARDSVTGRIGIAYIKAGGSVRYAFSDDEGANFSLATVGMDPGAGDSSFPQVALRGGTAHVAYVTSTEQVLYRTRAGSASTWTEVTAPVTVGQASSFGPISLALDSEGTPGLAYFTKGASLRGTLAFWRPSSASAATVADSDMTSVLMPRERRPSVSLAFAGTTPRVAYHLLRAEPVGGPAQMMSDSNFELWTSAATDASGSTWGTPVGVPRTGNMVTMLFNSTRWYQGLVIHPSGAIVIGAAYLANLTRDTLCGGGPKLARSMDGRAFDTCAPTNTPFSQSGDWLSMWGHAPNKVTMVFFTDRRVTPTLNGGIILYREP